MVSPKWLNTYLKTSELPQIEEAIELCETSTTAEVVPVVVRGSSNYYQSYVTLRLMGVAAFALIWFWFDWDVHWDHFEWSIVKVVVSFVVLCLGLPQLYRFDWIKKLMTHQREETEQVWKRAQIEFYANCVHETNEKEGVLIFVSILERQVVVLADKRVSDKRSQDDWDHVVASIVGGLKKKNLAEGLKEGIALCSDLLSEHFPVTSSDRDELPNKVIIKE